MPKQQVLLYGAYGYTGELIAQHAAEWGLRPVLAGRDKTKLVRVAQRFDFDHRVVNLEDPQALQAALQDCAVVIHAAGPFAQTALPMAKACLETQTHYLDITGEIEVFEQLKGLDQQAKAKGIMICPGVGFDVVPTDCLALLLKKNLPDATSLKLAFATLGSSVSHGTATTLVRHLGEPGCCRKDGRLTPIPLGKNSLWVDFGRKKLFTLSIPWGDLSTAHFTTGIPNIETYMAAPPSLHRALKWQSLYNPLLRTSWMRSLIQQRIDQRPPGPAELQRKAALSLVWGEVSNAQHQKVTARLSAPEGYTLTYQCALLIALKVLKGNYRTGYQTPANCYSEELIAELKDVQREINRGNGYQPLHSLAS
ncbi:MAG: saccharopine dehydrogenase family protein [Chitinophagaceae bacterium]